MQQLYSSTTNVHCISVGTMCILHDLRIKHKMNGKLCRIVSDFNQTEERYPVYVFETKNIVLIKPQNLKIIPNFNNNNNNNNNNYPTSNTHNNKTNINSITKINLNETQLLKKVLYYFEKLHSDNGYNAPRNGANMAQLFANQSKSMKSQFNQLNCKFRGDFESILTGHCIYIPHFFCQSNNYDIFNCLKNELRSFSESTQLDLKINNENESKTDTLNTETNSKSLCKDIDSIKDKNISNIDNIANKQENNYGGMIKWSRHLKHENPSFCKVFCKITDYLSYYFDCDIYATRLNYYRDGKDWKPFHHDSHAYDKKSQSKEDFTIGASFGCQRVLQFQHCKTNQIIDIPQKNGDIFAFNSIVNKKFMHGIPKIQNNAKMSKERFSIIAWGKRRTLNQWNAGQAELNAQDKNYSDNYDKDDYQQYGYDDNQDY